MRRMMALAGALLLAVPVSVQAQDASETGVFENGERFFLQYLVDFWRENPPGTTLGDDPSENAPGYISAKPKMYLHNVKLAPAEAALIERKLNIIKDALLALPPLQDIRGYSLGTIINVGKAEGSDRIVATLSIGLSSLNLDDPTTKQRDGRYYRTSYDVTSLDIAFNGLPSRQDVLGRYGALYVQRVNRGLDPFFVNSDRPAVIPASNRSGLTVNPAFFNMSARPSDLQILTMHVGLSSLIKGLEGGSHPPTSEVGRLLAAVYMADWNDIMQRVNAVR